MSAGRRPDDATTLIELLGRRAAEHGDRPAYEYRGEARTFEGLWTDIEGFAAALQGRGFRPGGLVVLALPNGHDFFTGFYGAQRAGGIPVPIFPGVPPRRIVEMARLCGARHVVVPADLPQARRREVEALADRITVLDAGERAPASSRPVAPDPGDVAFVQYTSGSTGDPKGVQLSHADLLTNVRQMIAGMEITGSDRFVSWLPSYHDMGLILMTMVPFCLAAPLILLPTTLRDTRPWLEAISRHRGTFTAAPDFGYRMCLRQMRRSGDASRFDLSSLRVALNAAEPVRVSTIEEFHQTFGLEDVMVAGYGLAEATVGVSMWKPSTSNRIDGRGVVSVGRPFPGVSIHILDDDDRPSPSGSPGHITVESPANTCGYFRNPEATRALLTPSGAVRTGDIGYLDPDGFLYVLGRAKDVIIQAGRSVYPEEVEEVANAVPGVRFSSAIGVDNGRVEGEQVTVLAEVRPGAVSDDAARRSCVMAIVRGVHERFGFRPGRVHLVMPRTIPLTHNGKLRRSELRRAYLDGSLDAALLYPPRGRLLVDHR